MGTRPDGFGLRGIVVGQGVLLATGSEQRSSG